MSTRLIAILVVAAFVLALGGSGGLLGLASNSVPWASAITPAGDDDDDDDGPDLDEWPCDELIELLAEIKAGDGEEHEEFIDLDELEELVADCNKAGGSAQALSLASLISGTGQPFELNFLGTGTNWVDVFGTFDPVTGQYLGTGVGTVAGFPNVTVELEMTVNTAGEVLGEYRMGAGGELPGGNAARYEITGTIPLLTPTPAAEPSDTPTPTDPAGQEVVWGNHNCSGDPLDPPDPVDSLLTLRHDAGLSTNTGDCPALGTQQSLLATTSLIWGDVDCSGEANPVDSLKILRFDAGLSVTQEANCPELGEAIIIAFG